MLDASIYDKVGNYPSLQDYQGRANALKLQQGQLDQLPLHEQMLRLQLAGAQLGNDQATQRNALLMPLLQKLAGGQQSNPQFSAGTNALASGAAQGSLGPTLGNAQAQSNALGAPGQSGGVNFPLSFGETTALHAAGGPDMLPAFKMALEGVYHPGGGFVTNTDGSQKYIPKLPDGMVMGPGGGVSNAPGFVGSMAETEGAKTGATERAKNQNQLAPIDRINPATGRPYDMTTAQLIDAVSPQPGSNLTGIPLNQRIAVATDAAARGVPMSSTKVNGQGGVEPNDLSGIRSEFAAAQKAGPAAVSAFEKQHLDAIAKLPPEQRYQAMAGFSNFMHQNAAAPAGFSGFAGPAELAGSKAGAEAGAKAAVELKTKPAIDFATKTADAAAEYRGKLDDTVSVSQDLQSRIAESRDALSKFTPGMGSETRLQVARAAKAMGAPDSLVEKINGGDISAKQEFMKLSAQTAMESLKSALGGSGRITQQEFRVFQQNNPNIELDPQAIQKIYDFATRTYQKTLAEQQGFSKYLDQGGDPAKWRSRFAAASDPTASGNIVIPGAAPKPGKPQVNDPLGLR